jgi:hypothetical protein
MNSDTDRRVDMEEDPYNTPTRLERKELVKKRAGRRRAMILGAVVLAAAVGGGVVLSNRDTPSAAPTPSDSAATVATTAAPAEPIVVSDSDEVITEIPQEPSLAIVTDDGFAVENDGNVTMSDVAVVAADGSTICDLGTLAPGDVAECAEADGDAVTVTGAGPQGQAVEISS